MRQLNLNQTGIFSKPTQSEEELTPTLPLSPSAMIPTTPLLPFTPTSLEFLTEVPEDTSTLDLSLPRNSLVTSDLSPRDYSSHPPEKVSYPTAKRSSISIPEHCEKVNFPRLTKTNLLNKAYAILPNLGERNRTRAAHNLILSCINFPENYTEINLATEIKTNIILIFSTIDSEQKFHDKLSLRRVETILLACKALQKYFHNTNLDALINRLKFMKMYKMEFIYAKNDIVYYRSKYCDLDIKGKSTQPIPFAKQHRRIDKRRSIISAPTTQPSLPSEAFSISETSTPIIQELIAPVMTIPLQAISELPAPALIERNIINPIPENPPPTPYPSPAILSLDSNFLSLFQLCGHYLQTGEMFPMSSTPKTKPKRKRERSPSPSSSTIPKGCESIKPQIENIRKIKSSNLLTAVYDFLATQLNINNNEWSHTGFRIVLACINFPQGCTLENFRETIPKKIKSEFGTISTELDFYRKVALRSDKYIVIACNLIQSFCKDNPIIKQLIQRLAYMLSQEPPLKFVNAEESYRSVSHERDYKMRSTTRKRKQSPSQETKPKKNRKRPSSQQNSSLTIPEGCESIKPQIENIRKIKSSNLLTAVCDFFAAQLEIKNTEWNRTGFRIILACINFPQGCTLENFQETIPTNIKLEFGTISTEQELYRKVALRADQYIVIACKLIQSFCKDNPIIKQLIQRLVYMRCHKPPLKFVNGEKNYRSVSHEQDYKRRSTKPSFFVSSSLNQLSSSNPKIPTSLHI